MGRGPPPSSERTWRTTSPMPVPITAHATRIHTVVSALRERRPRPSIAITPDAVASSGSAATVGKTAGAASSLSPVPGRSDALFELFELLDRHQHGPGLRALGRADDTSALHQVHEPAGAGEPDAQLALQHARRPEP